MASNEKSSVKVAVRIRPINKRENKTDVIVLCNSSSIIISNPSDRSKKTFTYDYVYDTNTSQEKIHEDIGSGVIRNAHDGYNTCVFAYGQTGSGKSYSMMGSCDDNTYEGLIPRICKQLFNYTDRQVNKLDNKLNNDTDRQVNKLDNKLNNYTDRQVNKLDNKLNNKVELSYLEIYSEQVRDLLSRTPTNNLRVRQHPDYGPYVENLTQIIVDDYASISKLIEKGNQERVVASTLMNNHSSRSHAILTLYFTQIKYDETTQKNKEIVSKINLVDLAGSERVESSGVTGINFQEATMINKSLSALGLVINKLALRKIKMKKTKKVKKTTLKKTPISKSKSNHIPFRDSVLTWILSESLGGNSKTYMLATISPSSLNYNESLSTLRFASNAKQIVNTVKINEDPNDKLIRTLQDEVAKLKAMLSTGSLLTSKRFELQDDLEQKELFLNMKEKSWVQKQIESDQLISEIKQQHKDEIAKMQEETEHIIISNEQKLQQQQEEYEKKQHNFEKIKIVETAVELQQYYDKKLEEIQQQYKQKAEEIQQHKQKAEDPEKSIMIEQINNLKQSNIELKKDLNNKMKQFTNDRSVLSKQIQQLQSKIHSMENIIKTQSAVEELKLKAAQEENRYTILQEECKALDFNIEINKQLLYELNEQHTKIVSDINNNTNQLNTLKEEYINLQQKFELDKNEYEQLCKKKETLDTEIVHLKSILDTYIEYAREKLTNPTTDDLIRIKDGFDNIFNQLKPLN